MSSSWIIRGTDALSGTCTEPFTCARRAASLSLSLSLSLERSKCLRGGPFLRPPHAMRRGRQKGAESIGDGKAVVSPRNAYGGIMSPARHGKPGRRRVYCDLEGGRGFQAGEIKYNYRRTCTGAPVMTVSPAMIMSKVITTIYRGRQ